MRKRERIERNHRYLPKTIALEPAMIDYLDDEAYLREWSTSELVRKIVGCYRDNAAEFERLCPELKVSRPAGAL
jgi:hypothetical protein